VAVLGALAAGPLVHQLPLRLPGHGVLAGPGDRGQAWSPGILAAVAGEADRLRARSRPSARPGHGLSQGHRPKASGRHHRPAPAGAAPAGAAPAGAAPPVRCPASGPLLPAHLTAIVRYLMRHGYTGVAAAGIAGNIYQESGGNPESVGEDGGGLIGWTPLPAGFVTGNPPADLRTQLAALLAYDQRWAGYLPELNAAASPAAAAGIYLNDFERASLPAAGTREAAAGAVAAACGLGTSR
jgi:hypothetical protein